MSKVTEWENDVGPGWRPLLAEMHAELAAIRPGYETLQVKEKWGVLTVYIKGGSDKIWPVLIRYLEKSRTVCEDCGAPGETRKGRAWLRTLCDACEAGRQPRRMVQSPEGKEDDVLRGSQLQ